MNERIEKLAEQAGLVKILDEHAHEYGNGMFENTPYPELEKLAKLIVQKCADIGERYADGNYEVYNQILKHFGMEEE